MGMPAAAKKQIKEAEKLHAELYAQAEEKPETVETPPEEPTEVMQAEETPSAEVVQEQPVTAPTEAEPAPKPETDWEQRYKTLQGKYNAEMPRMNAQIKDLQEVISQLQKPPATPEPVRPSDIPQQKLVTDSDIEDYGEEFIDVVRRVAKQEYDPVIQRLEKENQQLRSQVGGVTSGLQQNARERLLSSLEARVPDWREINNSDDFIEWLSHYDPFSGQKRHDLLLSAFEENNEARTIAFFEGYRNENAAVAPQAEPPRKTVPSVDMEKLVAPGQVRNTGNVRAQEGSAKVWTHDEINRFYADVVAGRYRGKEKDKRRMEADIIRAGRENRIH